MSTPPTGDQAIFLTGEERRKQVRRPINFLMRFSRWNHNGLESCRSGGVEIVGTDLSEGGAGGVFKAEDLAGLKLDPGDRMMIEIQPSPGGEGVIAAASLAWSRQQGTRLPLVLAGFRFDQLSPEASRYLSQMAVPGDAGC